MCHYCLFFKFLETAMRKLDFWQSKNIKPLANVYEKRILYLTQELEALKECRCEGEPHEQFKSRLKKRA